MIDHIFKLPALTYADGDHPQEHFAGVEKTVKGIGFDLLEVKHDVR